MSERESPESKPQASSAGVSLARAVRIGVVLFGLLVAVVAIALMVTDGSPHIPFDYGGSE